MKIFVDFDNTIFDTRYNFSDAFFEIFEKYSISEKTFRDTLPYFSKTSLQVGECYSPKNHIKIIKKKTNKNINEKAFLQEMSKFLEDLENFVFDDFYIFANKYNRKGLVVLSYGEYEFQKQKITGSNIEQFFGDTIITQGDKTIEIEKYMQNFPDESAVLIDDKLGYFKNAKKSNINIKTIHILRDDSACKEGEFCDFEISNLTEINDII